MCDSRERGSDFSLQLLYPPSKNSLPSPLRKLPDPLDPTVAPMDIESSSMKKSFKEVLVDNHLTMSRVYHPNYHQEEAALKAQLEEEIAEEIIMTKK